jgi:hypothetical protein
VSSDLEVAEVAQEHDDHRERYDPEDDSAENRKVGSIWFRHHLLMSTLNATAAAQPLWAELPAIRKRESAGMMPPQKGCSSASESLSS